MQTGKRSGRRLLWWLAGEVAGVVLLVAFVVALATMPPIQVQPSRNGLLGYSFKLDAAQWMKNATGYTKAVRSGELGKNRRGDPAGPLVAGRLGNSLLLMGAAAAIAVVLGVVKGFWDFEAIRRRRLAVGPVVTSALAGLPDFWLVLLLQLLAAWMYRELDIQPFRTSYDATDPASSFAFPLLTLCLIPMAHVARVTATAMGNVYDREYIRTARAKGLTEFRVIYKHALRNAVVQILDGLPGVMAIMVSNLLIVEYLYNYPGLTTLLKEAISPTVFSSRGGFVQPAPPDTAVVVLSGVALGLVFTLLYVVLQALRRAADPRLKGGGEA